MKKKLCPLLLVVGLLPFTAHAGLLGRVNSYYSVHNAEVIQKAQQEFDKAVTEWNVANNAAVKDANAITTTKAAVDNARLALEAAKIQLDKLGLFSADTNGLKEGTGTITVSTVTGGGTPIDFAAYQMNMLLWKANCEKNERKHFLSNGGSDCTGEGTTSYRFIPMYLLLHKTVISQVNKSTLTNDLLNHEHGGLFNIKFTPSLLEFAGLNVIKHENRDPNAMYTALGLDFGIKGVEAPSVADPKTANLIGAAYFGMGINFEYSLFNSTLTMQDIASGRNKPDGHLAVGFGVYSNKIDNSNIDLSEFISPVPKTFGTYVLSYEFQVNNIISLVGGRSLPTGSNSLGSYTSFAVRYQPAK